MEEHGGLITTIGKFFFWWFLVGIYLKKPWPSLPLLLLLNWACVRYVEGISSIEFKDNYQCEFAPCELSHIEHSDGCLQHPSSQFDCVACRTSGTCPLIVLAVRCVLIAFHTCLAQSGPLSKIARRFPRHYIYIARRQLFPERKVPLVHISWVATHIALLGHSWIENDCVRQKCLTCILHIAWSC